MQFPLGPQQVRLLFHDGHLPLLRDAPIGVHCPLRAHRHRPSEKLPERFAEKLTGRLLNEAVCFGQDSAGPRAKRFPDRYHEWEFCQEIAAYPP